MTYIHVDFKNTEHVDKFDSLGLIGGASRQYVEADITELIYIKETGEIMWHMNKGKEAYSNNYDHAEEIVDIMNT